MVRKHARVFLGAVTSPGGPLPNYAREFWPPLEEVTHWKCHVQFCDNDSQHLAKAAGAVIMSTSQIGSFLIMGNATCAHQVVK